jgi:iron complex transport system ATP-binding protein
MRERAREIVTLVGAEKLRSEASGRNVCRAAAARDDWAGAGGYVGEGDVKMLLLDEPSNALDLSAQRDLREMLRVLAQQGVAILLITHHIADILPEIDRIVMMREGRIVEDGSEEELLTEEKLGELFGGGIHLSERDGYFNAW